MATTTVRLPEPLKVEAETLAASLGISMNALMAVALRDYLDRPVTRMSGAPSKPELPAGPVPVRSAEPGPSYPAPRSRSDPCPCGARNVNGTPIKWKHCHGQA